MIRRDDGPDWLLISQVEHAHLAAEVAAVWGNDAVPSLPVPELLVPAIRFHDEGWSEWERSALYRPRADFAIVDQDTGQPRSFTEMPMPVSTRLWTTSIEACGHQSPLAGIWVSRHFCWLAENARQHRLDQPEELAALDAFLDEQAGQQELWKRDAGREFSAGELERLVEVGFRFVQFFDRLSLWLCCGNATTTTRLSPPGSPAVHFTPLSDNQIAAQPFPLSVDELPLSVPVQRIPARRYTDDADFQAVLADAPPDSVRWRIVKW